MKNNNDEMMSSTDEMYRRLLELCKHQLKKKRFVSPTIAQGVLENRIKELEDKGKSRVEAIAILYHGNETKIFSNFWKG